MGGTVAGFTSLIFALMYGLGLRVGEAARLCRQDVDLERNLLVIRETKFLKSRLVPFGPKIGARLRDYLQQQTEDAAALESDHTAVLLGPTDPRRLIPGTISQTFHALWPRLGLKVSGGHQCHRACTASVIRLPSARCCAGTVRASIHSNVCGICPPSWGTCIPPQPPSISRSRPSCWNRPTSASTTSPRRCSRRWPMNTDLGSLLYSFFEDYLKCQKGLRPSSLKSYRDSVRLFLLFLAEKTGHKSAGSTWPT